VVKQTTFVVVRQNQVHDTEADGDGYLKMVRSWPYT
jgi:hypothetical protein